MGRIAWDTAGTRFYEAGVDRGVLYIDDQEGVPWIGLISVDEKPSGGEAKPRYIDGRKRLNLAGVEEFEASIRAYTYPVEFSKCDGTGRIRPGLFFSEQPRKSFGFSYRTMIGNDTYGKDYEYKIHLVYNALATPSSRSASSYNDNVEASEFTWDLTTKARSVSGRRPTAHVVIDSRYTHPVTLSAIEDLLYGGNSNIAQLPTPEELMAIFDVPIAWSVFDNGDGTFTVSGPDENVMDIGLGYMKIDHPSVTIVNADTFTITY